MLDEHRRRRIAENEALFRGVNEGIRDAAERFDAEGPQYFVCECGDGTCMERVPLTPSEFAALRASAGRFAIVPGHEILEVERVVSPNEDFIVVEKMGIAGDTDQAPGSTA